MDGGPVGADASYQTHHVLGYEMLVFEIGCLDDLNVPMRNLEMLPNGVIGIPDRAT
jgi:hypothetical protein